MPRYDFRSPGADAGNAIQEFLVQRKMEERQRMLDASAQQQQDSVASYRDRDISLREQQQQQRMAQAEQDEIQRQEEAQRQASIDGNLQGMNRRAADVMMQGRPDADTAYKMQAEFMGEGFPVPGVISGAANPQVPSRQMMTLPAEGGNGQVQMPMSDEEIMAMGGVPVVEAPTDDSWQTAGNGYLFNPRTSEFKQIPGGDAASGGAPGEREPSSYADLSQSRLFTALTDLKPLINDDTVGTWKAKAWRSSPVPGEHNPTVDFDAALVQINALIGFGELNAMRAASPTGGALGQVSERELTYLQSVAASLDPDQSQEQYLRQWQKVMDEVSRVVSFGIDGDGRGVVQGAGVGGQGAGARGQGAGPSNGASPMTLDELLRGV